jgi:hypothetical protein
MVFRSVGTNLARMYVDGVGGLAEDLERLESAGPDFVEVWPQNLGVILGGRLDTSRLRAVGELLLGRIWRTRSTPRSRSTSWT